MQISSFMSRAARALTHLWNLATDDDYCLLADFVAEPVPGLTWVGAAEPKAAPLTRKMPIEELRALGHHARRVRVGTQTRKLSLAELPPAARLGLFQPELAVDSERVVWPELELGEFVLEGDPCPN